jgi:hypothetical protein
MVNHVQTSGDVGQANLVAIRLHTGFLSGAG